MWHPHNVSVSCITELLLSSHVTSQSRKIKNKNSGIRSANSRNRLKYRYHTHWTCGQYKLQKTWKTVQAVCASRILVEGEHVSVLLLHGHSKCTQLLLLSPPPSLSTAPTVAIREQYIFTNKLHDLQFMKKKITTRNLSATSACL
jgi:hypothetical protein